MVSPCSGLIQAQILGLQYSIMAFDGGVLREVASGITKVRAGVADSKATALTKARILIASTTRSRLWHQLFVRLIYSIDKTREALLPVTWPSYFRALGCGSGSSILARTGIDQILDLINSQYTRFSGA
jgi:hypothetical protein